MGASCYRRESIVASEMRACMAYAYRAPYGEPNIIIIFSYRRGDERGGEMAALRGGTS